MKKILTTTALCLAVMSAVPAVAADGSSDDFKHWMVRGRALGVIPQESGGIAPPGVGGHVEIDDSLVPELDFSYFFTPNIAAELILATTPHDVGGQNTALGNIDLGNAWLLPPTLTLQYHFTQFSFKPYVGAGVNYTIFYNEKPGSLNNVEYSNSFGPALQAGVDIPIDENWHFNVDVKKVWIRTDAEFNNNTIRSNVHIDPLLVGVGFGYRF